MFSPASAEIETLSGVFARLEEKGETIVRAINVKSEHFSLKMLLSSISDRERFFDQECIDCSTVIIKEAMMQCQNYLSWQFVHQ